ncbi:HD-GYP domain-containing protein (c-di-GMP phosphodiesterase class II) [Lysinibacillus composti]|uniref:HD-GYP domain-containing protein n=1 Tax=Lysinibacillus composti TaxID=720633 RepID=A0A3N9UCI9_9BACI|nr:HD-GYP domain-containing protein [Lysinibacillus composti]MBM7609512.1 HD-GYP domain-containing protein (c-di-GMP phosphodiesterase class II) [Lysinibacillus composti]RQW74041.1 HD-GYP domain-containing protein [Lysinibacillus composti]
MEATYIKVSDLQLGEVVAEDIYANTQHPILFKDTEITNEHLQIFSAFNISKVIVYIEDGEENQQKKQSSTEETIVQELSFEMMYKSAVNQFEREFLSWEAGSIIDIAKVRTIILPLVDEVLKDRTKVYKLNNYSVPKKYLYHHCIATGIISSILASKLGFDRGYILQVAIAGVLADCGMSKIAKRIRDKKGSLSEVEFKEIRRHPLYSFNMVKDLTALKKEMKVAIYQHHERLDGSGYIEGKKLGDDISFFSQIIAVADTFHAMTSERIYRAKESPFKVVEMIKESEFGKFDIKVVSALISTIAHIPIGTTVELSNLEKGEVMFNNSYSPTRPLVKLMSTSEIIDLASHRNLYISRII